MAETIYISVDVECSGFVPSLFSMYSIGAEAYGPGAKVLGHFSVNLKELPGAGLLPEVQEFWLNYPAAWRAHRVNPVAPERAMLLFASWLMQIREACGPRVKLVFVAWPLGFDWQFINWYFAYTGVGNPFDGMFDLRSYAMGKLGLDYDDAAKSKLPPALTAHLPPHTHVALDDARSQGELFCRLFYGRTRDFSA